MRAPSGADDAAGGARESGWAAPRPRDPRVDVPPSCSSGPGAGATVIEPMPRRMAAESAVSIEGPGPRGSTMGAPGADAAVISSMPRRVAAASVSGVRNACVSCAESSGRAGGGAWAGPLPGPARRPGCRRAGTGSSMRRRAMKCVPV